MVNWRTGGLAEWRNRNGGDERRNGRMIEWSNGRTADWRNGGMAEWRNGGMAEWRNGRMAGKIAGWPEWLPTYHIYGTRRRHQHRHLLVSFIIQAFINTYLCMYSETYTS
jgi:hypothetical protein